MTHAHAIVWMDSREAHTFRFSPSDVEKERIRAHSPFHKVHHKAGEIGAGHAHLDREYMDGIVGSLDGVEEWLLTGPGTAKSEFASHLERHAPNLRRKLLSIEAANHPTDGELLAGARKLFKRLDHLRPNAPKAKHAP